MATVVAFIILLSTLVFAVESNITKDVSPLAAGLCGSLILSVTVMILGFAKYAFAPLDAKQPDTGVQLPAAEATKAALSTVGEILSEAGKAIVTKIK
ncbi:hypothetical protein [Hydrogenophaga sp. 2FB]|uniref:hypothetical protein n=1 Tax=Hydrogenophaga sp. 2FB TaxID=2502187 RepID=UPI0010F65F55|nr:hypothetical protein [Hydrogenophaga sp. 2FB]